MVVVQAITLRKEVLRMKEINLQKFDIDKIVDNAYSAKTFTSNKKLTEEDMLDIIKTAVYESLRKYHKKLMVHLKE